MAQLTHDETQDLLGFIARLCASAGWKSYARRIDRMKRRLAAQAAEEADNIAVPLEDVDWHALSNGLGTVMPDGTLIQPEGGDDDGQA